MGKELRSEERPRVERQFDTTRWSLVLAAAHSDWERAAEPLGSLCRTYWFPIYTYIRRAGHSAEDAQDLAQEFFARLLQKGYLRAADPEKGRFRSFLLIVLKRFLANEWDRQHRIKRGGGREHLSAESEFFERENAERCYREDPVDGLTPAEAFERRWAITLLNQVLARLEQEFLAKQDAELFDNLKHFLTDDVERGAYAAVARKMAMTEGALRVAVHRLRHRYRDLLRFEIAQTVSRPEEIDEEIDGLFTALSR